MKLPHTPLVTQEEDGKDFKPLPLVVYVELIGVYVCECVRLFSCMCVCVCVGVFDFFQQVNDQDEHHTDGHRACKASHRTR